MPDVHHETVFFEGRVQGVGFRYQTLQLAREFDVSGFIGNQPDGRVLLEVEGEAAEVSAFVEALRERMTGYIRRLERSSGRRAAQFNGFMIK
jgi:acylphosphatase